MQLTFAEKLQIMRKRTGLNQGAFGAKAFDLPVDSGRTKIKNIELGKQHPTDEEIGQMARVLGVSVEVMKAERTAVVKREEGGISVSAKVLDRFPKLEAYLEMLNKAVSLEDDALIAHIGETLATIFQPQPQQIIKQIK